MIKRTILTLCVASLCLAVNAQTPKTASKPTTSVDKPMSAVDSASYSFGLKIAMGLKSDGVKNLNYALLSKAMDDVFNGKTLLVSDEQAGPCISDFLKKTSQDKFAGLQEAGKKFLEDNKKNPKVMVTASGLQYEVLTLGTGVKPKATDTVTVHYKGTLLDGKEFDSSYSRNEPLTLPLNSVIPGWTEGVQLMPSGSKYRFYIPYQLAYGERGAGQDIPP
ncbi:MAG: FKBP-type peptidyl-prolyl cis-trans isomerase, partial [Candidatus Dojkabacteria bacterium]